MRPIEIVWLLSLLALLLAMAPAMGGGRGDSTRAASAARMRRSQLWIALASVGIGGLHLLVEGVRWQMAPAYLLAAIVWFLVAVGATRRSQPAPAADGPTASVPSWRRWIRRAGVLAATLGATLLLASPPALSWLFPVFELPTPTGPHAVGTIRLELTDRSRREMHTDDPDDPRRLIVRAWYPAAAESGPPAPYWSDASARSRELGRLLELPGFLFSHLDLVRTHAKTEAALPAGRARHPVVIFSHGMFSFPEQNTTLAQELASHGYVVFSIAHAHWGLRSEFSDGRVATVGEVGTRYGEAAEDEAPDVQEVASEQRGGDSADGVMRFLEELIRRTPATTRLYEDGHRLWSADQRFVLDALVDLQRNDGRFAGRLDLERVAVAGMSFGGSVAVYTCALDPRCAAGVSLDGFSPTPRLLDLPPIRTPFLYMDSDEHLLGPDAHRALVARMHEGPTSVVPLAEAEHFDLSDFTLVSPLFRWAGQLGPIGSERALALTNERVLAFLDRHLKGPDEAPAEL